MARDYKYIPGRMSMSSPNSSDDINYPLLDPAVKGSHRKRRFCTWYNLCGPRMRMSNLSRCCFHWFTANNIEIRVHYLYVLYVMVSFPYQMFVSPATKSNTFTHVSLFVLVQSAILLGTSILLGVCHHFVLKKIYRRKLYFTSNTIGGPERTIAIHAGPPLRELSSRLSHRTAESGNFVPAAFNNIDAVNNSWGSEPFASEQSAPNSVEINVKSQEESRPILKRNRRAKSEQLDDGSPKTTIDANTQTKFCKEHRQIIVLWPLGGFTFNDEWVRESLVPTLIPPVVHVVLIAVFMMAQQLEGIFTFHIFNGGDNVEQLNEHVLDAAVDRQVLLLIAQAVTPVYPFSAAIWFNRIVNMTKCSMESAFRVTLFVSVSFAACYSVLQYFHHLYTLELAITSWVVLQAVHLVQCQWFSLVEFHPLFKFWRHCPPSVYVMWRKALHYWDDLRHEIGPLWSVMGIPDHLRAAIWPLAIGNPAKISQELFDELDDNTPRKASISINLDRMYSDDTQELSDFEKQYVSRVLLKFASFSQRYRLFSYHQGMSYLVGCMLTASRPIGMEEYVAFQCLVNLMYRDMVDYVPGVAQIERDWQTFDDLLKFNKVCLHAHLARLNCQPQMRIMEWFPTLFTTVLPPHIVRRVWDGFFLHGKCYLYKISIAIIQTIAPQLRRCETNPACVKLLENIPVNLFQEERFFREVDKVIIPAKTYRRLHKKYFACCC